MSPSQVSVHLSSEVEGEEHHDNRLPPPHTLIMDYTMTHIRFGCSHFHPMVQLTNTWRSDGAPDPDGDLKEVVRIKIRHFRNVYLNHPDPISFIPLTVDTTRRLYDEFIRLLFFHDHREESVWVNEFPEESDQFRFLRASCFAHLKVLLVWWWWMHRPSGFQSLSSWSFISLHRFIRSCRPTPILAPSLVLFPPCSV